MSDPVTNNRRTNYTVPYLNAEARRILKAAMNADDRRVYPGMFSVTWTLDVHNGGATLRANAYSRGMFLLETTEAL